MDVAEGGRKISLRSVKAEKALNSPLLQSALETREERLSLVRPVFEVLAQEGQQGFERSGSRRIVPLSISGF
jgi:hypothetical protein